MSHPPDTPPAHDVTRRAACSCGRLSATATGEPVRVSICHCLACQRRSGGVFAIQARFPVGRVRIEGDATQFVRTGDEGSKARFHACPTCSDTVYYLADREPDVVFIPVGAFADPGFPAPTVSNYEERMHPWMRLPDDITHYH